MVWINFKLLIPIEEERLLHIAPVEKGFTNLLYYVKNYDLYDILIEVHVNIGHGSKHRMMADIKKRIQKFDSRSSRSCTYVFEILWTLSNKTVI